MPTSSDSSFGDLPDDARGGEAGAPGGQGGTPPAEGGFTSAEQEVGTIQVTQEADTIVILVRGHLDHAEGQSLMSVASAAIHSKGANRLDIDLRELDSFTSEGADALVACRALGSRLADGLHYRTGRGAGRSALLAAYRAVDTGEMQAIRTENGDGTSHSS